MIITADYKYIRYFNNTIQLHSKLDSIDSTIEAIDQYKRRYGHQDYYSAMDSIGFKVGIAFNEEYEYNGFNEIKGYYPVFMYKPNNLLNRPPDIEVIGYAHRGYYRSQKKCWEHLAKELLYKFMRVPDFEEVINT